MNTKLTLHIGTALLSLSALIHQPSTSLAQGTALTFTNPVPAEWDEFGYAVAAVGSDRVLVGAFLDDAGGMDAGAAYLFSTNGNLLTTFTNPFPTATVFGLALTAVGYDCVLIGAPDPEHEGVAYLFRTDGRLLTTFTNPTPALYDYFGGSVAAVGNERVLIGAYNDDTGAEDAGAAYLFGTNGTLLMTFTNPAPADLDNFGNSVAAVGNDRVLIGAFGADLGASEAGVAYLFDTNGTLLTTFLNPTPGLSDYFGRSVAAMGNDHVLIGAYNAGAAYVFSTNGTLLTTLLNPAPVPNDFFGISVAAVGTDHVLVSALNASGWGAVYLFSTDGTLLTTLTNPTPALGDGFGYSLAVIGGDRLLIGAYQDDTGAENAGAAYLFPISFAPPQTNSCIDLRNAPPPPGNPWTYDGVSFSGTNFDGTPLPTLQVRSLGSFTGLDCGWGLEITWTNSSCDSIEITLVSFAQEAEVTTYDGSGAVLETKKMTVPPRTAETLRFRGQNVARLVIVAPSDETLLLELCCREECPLPVIPCTNREVECGSSWIVMPPMVLDECCPDHGPATLVSVVTNGTDCGQVIILNWQYTNCMQRTASCTQSIFVRDRTPPIAICPSDKVVECGQAWSFDPPSGYDTCCGTNVTITPVGPPIIKSTACPFIVEQTWAISDCGSNTVFCTQRVSRNMIPPIAVCPSNMVVWTSGTNAVPVTWGYGVASGPCDRLAGATSSPPSGSAFLPDTTTTVTVRAWTECLVANSCTFTVTVLRARLGVTRSDGDLILHWNDGILQQADTVNGPYKDVPQGMPPTYTILTTNVAGFYRLRRDAPVGTIPAGNYNRGDALDGLRDAPLYPAYVSQFFIEPFLVTGDLWSVVKRYADAHGYTFDYPGSYKELLHPVHTVNWFDAVKWCNARSEFESRVPVYYTDAGFAAVYKTGQVAPYTKPGANGWRLPTEAEWEKAARGGLDGKRFPWGDSIRNGSAASGGQANYYGDTSFVGGGGFHYDLGPNGYNSAFDDGQTPYTSPVGSFPANGYGLFDMAGNVYEWCWDWYDGSYYASGQSDPQGPASGGTRVLRGGTWADHSFSSRCAYRLGASPFNGLNTLGFRCARGL